MTETRRVELSGKLELSLTLGLLIFRLSSHEADFCLESRNLTARLPVLRVKGKTDAGRLNVSRP